MSEPHPQHRRHRSPIVRATLRASWGLGLAVFLAQALVMILHAGPRGMPVLLPFAAGLFAASITPLAWRLHPLLVPVTPMDGAARGVVVGVVAAGIAGFPILLHGMPVEDVGDGLICLAGAAASGAGLVGLALGALNGRQLARDRATRTTTGTGQAAPTWFDTTEPHA